MFNMNKIFSLAISLFALSVCSVSIVNAQGGVAISASGAQPDNSAVFDVSSLTKGELMPRMSTVQRDAIANPATGLFIFNTDCFVINYNAGTPSNPNWATVNASNVLVAGVSITASPAGAICTGTSVTFSATPSQNNLSPTYQWQVNGGNVGTNSSTYTTTSLNNGDVVTCILLSSVNCVSGSPATSNAIIELVSNAPTITGTTPASFCSGSSVSLGASASSGTINWYAFSTGGSSLSTGASFTISGLGATTTYYVDATANGCTSPERTAVTATYYPSAPSQPGAITGPSSGSRDSSSTYSISAVYNTASYNWTVAGGIITSGQGTTSITVLWGDSSANASVSVTASNPCGTSAAQNLSVSLGIQSYSFSGSVQTFTVPTGVTTLNIEALGAQGGNHSPGQYYSGNSYCGCNGGNGADIKGTFTVTPGQVISIIVGQQGSDQSGGNSGNGGAGGGGGSFVYTAGPNLLIAAGGGGGGALYDDAYFASYPNGPVGVGGQSGNCGSASRSCWAGGCGGGSGSGDLAGLGWNTIMSNPAGVGYGGYGGGGSAEYHGGGGGGGYSGGGGDGATNGCGASYGDGGGGGGSYNAGTNQTNNAGVQNGNGQVIFTW